MVNFLSMNIESATFGGSKKKSPVLSLNRIKSSMKKANNYKPTAHIKAEPIKKSALSDAIKLKMELAKAAMNERKEKTNTVDEKKFDGDLYEIDISRLFIIPKNKMRPDLIVVFKKVDVQERNRAEKVEKLKRKRSTENYYANDDILSIHEMQQDKKRKNY